MSAHLSPQDQIAAVDARLDASKVTHLASCPACEASVAEVRALVLGLKADEVPEPSPLFWDHFSARVRSATEAEPSPSAWALGWRVWATLASSATAFVLVLVVRHGSVSPPPPAAVAPPPSSVATSSAAIAPSRETATDAEPMTAIVQAASSLSSEDLTSVVTITEEVTPFVEDLSATERAAFVRLLSAEMEKTP